MNKFKSLIVLSLMLFVGGQVMGQTHGTMFLGVSIPAGDFAKGNELASTALWGNEDQTYGGAAIGFNAGVKWDFGVGVKGLAVLLTVDGFFNGPSAAMQSCYQEKKEDLEDGFENVELTIPKYINVPLMLGLRYSIYLNPQFGIYAEGGAGANVRFITDYTEHYVFNEQGADIQVNHRNTWTYSADFAFAWQVGLGIEVSNKFVIGCSFYDLGPASVKGEVTYKSGSSGNFISDISSFQNGQLHPMMILGRIGFRF